MITENEIKNAKCPATKEFYTHNAFELIIREINSIQRKLDVLVEIKQYNDILNKIGGKTDE